MNCEGDYEAALFVGGKYVGGPPLPLPLTIPKGDITHWMGDKPSIGLSMSEAERIIQKSRQKTTWFVTGVKAAGPNAQRVKTVGCCAT